MHGFGQRVDGRIPDARCLAALSVVEHTDDTRRTTASSLDILQGSRWVVVDVQIEVFDAPESGAAIPQLETDTVEAWIELGRERPGVGPVLEPMTTVHARIFVVQLAEHTLELGEHVNVSYSDERRGLRKRVVYPRESSDELHGGGKRPVLIVVRNETE